MFNAWLKSLIVFSHPWPHFIIYYFSLDLPVAGTCTFAIKKYRGGLNVFNWTIFYHDENICKDTTLL
jgi:hypothetical protein